MPTGEDLFHTVAKNGQLTTGENLSDFGDSYPQIGKIIKLYCNSQATINSLSLS